MHERLWSYISIEIHEYTDSDIKINEINLFWLCVFLLFYLFCFNINFIMISHSFISSTTLLFLVLNTTMIHTDIICNNENVEEAFLHELVNVSKKKQPYLTKIIRKKNFSRSTTFNFCLFFLSCTIVIR